MLKLCTVHPWLLRGVWGASTPSKQIKVNNFKFNSQIILQVLQCVTWVITIRINYVMRYTQGSRFVLICIKKPRYIMGGTSLNGACLFGEILSSAPVLRRSSAGAPERRTLMFREISDFVSKIWPSWSIFNSGSFVFLDFGAFLCCFPRRSGHVKPGCTLSWHGGSIRSLFPADRVVNAARPAFSRSSFSRAELLG